LSNAPRKVLVESCDVNEEDSGLVRVGISYVCRGEDLATVSQTMMLDSEPPVYPQAVFRNQLQSLRLYQYQRTYELQYGLGRIRAFYAGVLNRNQQPQVRSDTETFSLTFPLTFDDIGRITGNYRGLEYAILKLGPEFRRFWFFNLPSDRTSLASFTISGRAIALRRRLAVVGTNSASLSAITLSQLLVSAQVDVFFGRWGTTANPGGSLEGICKDLLGIYAGDSFVGSRTPLEWLLAFPDRWSISAEFDNEFVTPSVSVLNGTSRLLTFDGTVAFGNVPPSDFVA
jgi:hypothetical protein